MQRQLILAIYVPTLLLAFCSGLLIPVLPIFVREEFSLSYGLIGLVLAANAIGMIIGDVPAGALVGRIGLKRSMLIGIAGMALGTLAFTWASGVYELILYAIFVGFASTLWNISRHAYLASAAPSGQRGRAIAIFGGINRMGSFVGPIVGGALGGMLGLRAPFFLAYGLTGMAYVGTSSAAMLFAQTPKLFVYRSNELLGTEALAVGLALGATGFLASYIGQWIAKRASARLFQYLVEGLLIGGGVLLLFA